MKQGPVSAVPRRQGIWGRVRLEVPRAVAAMATLVTLAIPAYVFLLFNDAMRHWGGFGDEGYFIWCGWSTTKGLAPYRDFMEFKPPFVFLTHALALALHGFAGFGFRAFFTYFPLGSVLAFQASLLTRRVDKWLVMGLGLALIHLWVNHDFHDTALSDTESIGLSYYFLGVAFLLTRTPRPGLMRAIGAALLFCCAQSKEPFLPCVVCTWAACFFASDRRGPLRADVRRYVKETGLGVLVVAVALVAYLLPTGALAAYIRMVGRYSVLYRDPKQSFCVAGGVFEPTTPLNDILRQWKVISQGYANLQSMGLLIPFALATVLYVRRRSWGLLLATACALAASMLAVGASNCPWVHYYNMLLAGLFFALAVGLDAMTPHFWIMPRSTRLLVRAGMLTAILIGLWPRVVAERKLYGTRTTPTEMNEPFPGVFEAVRRYTTAQDRIVTNGNPILYVQMDRVSGVRESNFLDPILGYYVGATDEEKLRPVYDEMMKSRPKLVVLDPSFTRARVRHERALWAPFLSDNHYKKIAEHIYLRPD